MLSTKASEKEYDQSLSRDATKIQRHLCWAVKASVNADLQTNAPEVYSPLLPR